MKFKRVLENYLRFEEVLARMGSLSFLESITLEKVKPKKGDIQAIYKQIKEVGFVGSAIEYLCYVSMLFAQYNWLLSIRVVTQRKIGDLIHLGNYEFKLRYYMQELMEVCIRDEENAKIMFRIFYKDPGLFFGSELYQEFLSVFRGVDEADLQTLCFNVLGAAYRCLHSKTDEENITKIFEAELKGLRKIALAPMYSIRADEAKNKKVLKLLSREAKVLDAIIEYLAEADRGDKISSIRKNVSKIFAKNRHKSRKIKIGNSIALNQGRVD